MCIRVLNFRSREHVADDLGFVVHSGSAGLVMGMSTRKGTVKFLDEILAEAKDSMHEQMAKNEEKYAQVEDPEYTSDVVGQTAVKIQDMSARR